MGVVQHAGSGSEDAEAWNVQWCPGYWCSRGSKGKRTDATGVGESRVLCDPGGGGGEGKGGWD